MQAGDVVADFTLQNQDGVSVSLSDYAAKPVVLFFYPRADTPGCTLESCGFRDIFAKFKRAGIVVLGDLARHGGEAEEVQRQVRAAVRSAGRSRRWC